MVETRCIASLRNPFCYVIFAEVQYFAPPFVFIPMRKAFLLIFCVLSAHLVLYGADIKSIGVPYVQNYTKAQYQSGNQNWSVTRDEHGVMYFGNAEGLLAFDGRYWQLYRMPNGLIVRSVAADGKGKIYAGGFGEFGYWQKDKRGFLKYNSLIPLVRKTYLPN